MAIYELAADGINAINETSFHAAGIRERDDLQRLLRTHIQVVCPDVLVVDEEFCEWEESRRRIDLLGLDKDANLVVIELKRTEDGGHMELQAMRYAAMVSAMTFEKVVEVYASFLQRIGSNLDARASILDFLKWDQPNEELFAQDVRIVLAAADFSKELTTAVIWLNERGIDIRCVRIKPYQYSGGVLIDVQQVIPLPEAEEFQVQIRQKAVLERTSRQEAAVSGEIHRRFWTQLLDKARSKTEAHARISPSNKHWIGARAQSCAANFNYIFGPSASPRVELYTFGTDYASSKKIFDQLHAQKDEIEKRFGGKLRWERKDKTITCRICAEVPSDASFDDENTWPQLQDAMIDMMGKFEKAIRPSLDRLS